MGNVATNEFVFKIEKPYRPLIADRMICVDPNIRIGVNGHKNTQIDNPLYIQKIKVNNESDAHSLLSVTETENTILYKFEKDIELQFDRKCDTDNKCDILFKLLYPGLNITKQMDPVVVDLYKNVSFSSPELDKIGPFIKQKN